MNHLKNLTKEELYYILVHIEAFPNRILKEYGYTTLESLKDDLLKTWLWHLSYELWIK